MFHNTLGSWRCSINRFIALKGEVVCTIPEGIVQDIHKTNILNEFLKEVRAADDHLQLLVALRAAAFVGKDHRARGCRLLKREGVECRKR